MIVFVLKAVVFFNANRAAHSGYPIMHHWDLYPLLTTAETNDLGWGSLHEIGHNMQGSKWTLKGQIQVLPLSVCFLFIIIQVQMPIDEHTVKISFTRFEPTLRTDRSSVHLCVKSARVIFGVSLPPDPGLTTLSFLCR